MVAAAKALPADGILPLVKMVITSDGLSFSPLGKSDSPKRNFPIEDISYGVQDLVYTRVFSMIVVRDTDDFRRTTPFECHGFVCESKHQARQLTYALAEAFRVYSERVKSRQEDDGDKKKFAIEFERTNRVAMDIVYDSWVRDISFLEGEEIWLSHLSPTRNWAIFDTIFMEIVSEKFSFWRFILWSRILEICGGENSKNGERKIEIGRISESSLKLTFGYFKGF